jgi:hypothetical protein
MSAVIHDQVGRLLKTIRIVPPVDPTVLRGLYDRKDYAKMLGWIKNSMRLDLRVGLRIVDTTDQSAPMWIETPGKMPLFGSPEFHHTRVIVNARKDLLDTKSFTWVVAGFAHELSHVVLFSIQHELQNDEKAVDLTAMILGYRSFIADAEITKTEGTIVSVLMAILLLPLGVLFWKGTTKKTQRLGYLTSTEAKFALRRLNELSRRL